MIRRRGPGGFWRRAAAMGIDGLWLFCVTGALTWLLFGGRLQAGAGFGAELIDSVIGNLLPAMVFIAGWRLFGATPGKLLLELRVVDARTGDRPSWPRSIVRYLAYFVSALPLGLGFAWAAFDRCGQGWHDKIARTRVLRTEETILPPATDTPRAGRVSAA